MTAPFDPTHAPEHEVRPVHLLAGLPTDSVRRGIDRIRSLLPVRALAEFIEPSTWDWTQMGVLLPPHLEASQVVDEWETEHYLDRRFGPGAHIGGVLALVDAELAGDQLNSADAISACGWGRTPFDRRTVADIAAGQFESATHLVLTGPTHSIDALMRLLDVLNPGAERLVLEGASDARVRDFVTRAPRAGRSRRRAASARIVPPWLGLLRAESPPSLSRDRMLYRRSRPFDPERFGAWFEDPPRGLVRGKGKVWLANRCEQAYGYSCAGTVHRVFEAGGWWASHGGTTWPACERERRRLLERWHPQFGDRRNEIAFLGVDLDLEQVASELDACLVSEEEALRALRCDSPATREAAAHADLH